MTMDDYLIVQSAWMGNAHNQITRVNPYAAIPQDPNNCDYINYLVWLALGYSAAIVDEYKNVIMPASYTPPGN